MLIILGGLPGVGKSSIGKLLAKEIQAVYLRIDSIEQSIKDAFQLHQQKNDKIGAEGYMAAYAVAKDNLELELTVIADSVNPIELTRNDYRKIALEMNKPYIEIEIICKDKAKHQQRVETRESTVKGLKLPTWEDVLAREYEPWKTKHLTIDTAQQSVTNAVNTIINTINKTR